MTLQNQIKEALLELHTVRDFVRFTQSRFCEAKLFFGHGSISAFDEAVYFMLFALHLPPDTELAPYWEARLTRFEKERFLSFIKERIEKRVPAAYVTQEAYLHGFRFYVDERAIVPRSLLAEPLLEGFSPWLLEEPMRILDLCTGGASLAILAAHTFSEAQIDAVDISQAALEVARQNIEAYELTDRIHAKESDAFLSLAGEKYDLIISNPPYVDAAAMNTLPEEYRHESALALGSGQDGLDFTRLILKNAKTHLHEGGVLVVEVGHQRAVLEAAFPHLPFTWLATDGHEEAVFLLNYEDLP